MMIISFAEFRDVNGNECDSILSGEHCDKYIKILINDSQVYRSATRWNDNVKTVFNEMYTTGKMMKNDKITLEIWDDDSGALGSQDDLMYRAYGTVNDCLQNKQTIQVYSTDSVLHWQLHWLPELAFD